MWLHHLAHRKMQTFKMTKHCLCLEKRYILIICFSVATFENFMAFDLIHTITFRIFAVSESFWTLNPRVPLGVFKASDFALKSVIGVIPFSFESETNCPADFLVFRCFLL